jgi:hypothetical protein
MRRPKEVNRENRERATVLINLSEDIKTLDELERSPRACPRAGATHGRLVVIAETRNPAPIVLTAERYESLVHLINFTRLANEGEEDLRAGRVRPLEEFVQELEDEGSFRVDIAESAQADLRAIHDFIA